ncbi:MAG: homoserine kinase [Bacteroidales bacterium]|nr:homoserine kinase [Bacteroidales bacterium]
MKRIKVFAPGTIANIGCGFDVMGLALDGVGDLLEAVLFDNLQQLEQEYTGEVYTTPNCTVSIKNSSNVALPTNIRENVLTPAILKMCEEYAKKSNAQKELLLGFNILEKIRPGSGIGSSAAASASGVYALNQLLDKPFTDDELVDFSMEGEKLISGTPHADNVAPAIIGGVVFIRGYNPTDLIRLPVPDNFFCTVVHPHITVSTKEAREILPKAVERKDAITQWGNVGGFVAGLLLNDLDLLGRSVKDVIAEPYRKGFIPGYDTLKETLLDKGMIGVNIAGSGPSVFALSKSMEQAKGAEEIMKQHFSSQNIDCEVYVNKVGKCGARIVE